MYIMLSTWLQLDNLMPQHSSRQVHVDYNHINRKTKAPFCTCMYMYMIVWQVCERGPDLFQVVRQTPPPSQFCLNFLLRSTPYLKECPPIAACITHTTRCKIFYSSTRSLRHNITMLNAPCSAQYICYLKMSAHPRLSLM